MYLRKNLVDLRILNFTTKKKVPRCGTNFLRCEVNLHFSFSDFLIENLLNSLQHRCKNNALAGFKLAPGCIANNDGRVHAVVAQFELVQVLRLPEASATCR